MIYRYIREKDFYDEILENIVKHGFDCEFEEDSIVIYSLKRITLSYSYPGLHKKFTCYFSERFTQRTVDKKMSAK